MVLWVLVSHINGIGNPVPSLGFWDFPQKNILGLVLVPMVETMGTNVCFKVDGSCDKGVHHYVFGKFAWVWHR
jgi:hypothetical protein